MLLVVLTLLCDGCYGSKETDEVAYTIVLGIDKAADGKRLVTNQYAVPSGLSSSDEKGSEQKVSWITDIGVIPASAEARMLLYSTGSRVPKYNHITAIIFSEEVAREGLNTVLSFYIRNHDFRETPFLIVVKGSAEEYIKQTKPRMEKTISKFYETFLSNGRESGYYLQTDIHDFYSRLKNVGGSPYVMYSGINPMTGENSPAGTKTPEQKGDPYLPGGIPRTGTQTPTDFIGLAVFRGDKMVGVLNSDETRAVAILQGNFPRGYVGVVDPLEPKKGTITLKVWCGFKPIITAKINDGIPTFDVQILIEAELLGVTSGINYEAPDYQELLETQTSNMFKKQIMSMIKHTQELGTDPVGFGLYLRSLFQNTDEMEQANMTSLYQAADIHVNVSTKIRRAGLIWRTTPIQNK
jgi:Ger(x)C family germination protein